ncbi:MAG: hypothetical protein HY665_05150 [Chloroflexi bacterium]|nr:hypothetical protein [Chloroflexota bacterium]
MDWVTFLINAAFIVLIIAIIFGYFWLRRGGRKLDEQERSEIAQGLLYEVRFNQALSDVFNTRPKPMKFEMSTWRRYKEKMDFFAEPIRAALSSAFVIVEDFNQQIDTARKASKSKNYKVTLDVDKLKEPLAASKRELDAWILLNVKKDTSSKYPGMWESLFGIRRKR